MLELEVIDGHISIYEVITQHGLSKPGSVWKQLQKHKAYLPPFAMKQFTMRDGRKGRLRPALPVEHQAAFETLLHQCFPQDQDLTLQEKAFLTLLQEIFPDLHSQRQVDVQGLRLDLWLEKVQVGVVLKSHFTDPTGPLQGPEGLQVLVFDPQQPDFSAGHAAYQIRQLLEHPTLSSNP